VLKHRLKKEGSQLVTNCNQLKLPAADGKSYLTDVANAETLLRLVQSVSSPKAELIKLWLPAPADTLERERRRHCEGLLPLPKPRPGRNLCSYGRPIGLPSSIGAASLWKTFGRCRSSGTGNDCLATGATNISPRTGLKTLELIFTVLAELSTRQIAESVDATGMAENGEATRTGGKMGPASRLSPASPPMRARLFPGNFSPATTMFFIGQPGRARYRFFQNSHLTKKHAMLHYACS